MSTSKNNQQSREASMATENHPDPSEDLSVVPEEGNGRKSTPLAVSRDQNTVLVEEIEQQLADTETALEITLRDRTELEQKVEELEQVLHDTRLQFNVTVLDKELEILNLTAQLRQSTSGTNIIVEKDNMIRQLEKEIEQNQSNIKTLTQLCIDNAASGAAAEARVTHQAEHIKALQQTFMETQFFLREHVATNEVYKTLIDTDAQLLKQNSEYEMGLQTTVEALKREVQLHKNAFHQLSAIFTTKESQAAVRIAALTQKVDELQNTVNQNAALLAPRWKKLMDQKERVSNYSEGAILLRSRNSLLATQTLKLERDFLLSCVTTSIWGVEVHIHTIGVILVRLTHQADLFMGYIFYTHYKDLIEDVQDNQQAVSKDKNFVRWLHDAVCSCCRLMAKTAQLFEVLRRLSFEDLVKYLALHTADPNLSLSPEELKKKQPDGVPPSQETVSSAPTAGKPVSNITSSLMTCLTAAESRMGYLLACAEADALTAVVDVNVIQNCLDDLHRCLDDMGTRGFPVSVVTGVQKPVETDTEFGIISPVLTSMARQAASTALLGSCGADNPGAVFATVPLEMWVALWDAATHILNRIPFGSRKDGETPGVGLAAVDMGELQMEGMSVGFGVVKMAKRAFSRDHVERFYSKAIQDIQIFDVETRSIIEGIAQEPQNNLRFTIADVGAMLSKVHNMCEKYAQEIYPTRSITEVSLWEKAVELVLRKVCDINSLQSAYETLRRIQERKELDLGTLSNEIIANKQIIDDWKLKYFELSRRVEQLSLLQPEVQQLRKEVRQYRELLQTKKVESDMLQSRITVQQQEQAVLEEKVAESTRILQSIKLLPKQPGFDKLLAPTSPMDDTRGAEIWDDTELSQIKEINKKLEKEMLALQMEKVEKDLDAMDLKRYLTGSTSLKPLLFSHLDDNKKRLPNLSTSIEHVRYELRDLLNECKSIQTQLLMHLVKVPLTLDKESYTKRIVEYRLQESVLKEKLSTLRRRIDLHYARLLTETEHADSSPESRSKTVSTSFGPIVTAASLPYLEDLRMAATTVIHATPAMRFTVNGPPLTAVNEFTISDADSGGNSPEKALHSVPSACKVTVTNWQLHSIKQTLLSI